MNGIPKLEDGNCDCYQHDDSSKGFCAKNCWTKESVRARDKALATLLKKDRRKNMKGVWIYPHLEIVIAIEEVLSVLESEAKN